MSATIKKENILRVFENLCNEYGTTGQWTIDFIACYGGYRIENKDGSNTIFLNERRAKKAFYNFMLDMLEAVRVYKRLHEVTK